MSEPETIVDHLIATLVGQSPLAGKRVLITAGPTFEPIDPVRYIANRSSGKQGHAIAAALAALGADVRLVSGPVTLPDPAGVKAACEREGRSSMCGSPDIAGCQCIDGQCATSASHDDLRLNQ